MLLTVMPNGASSIARFLINIFSPPLLAQYEVKCRNVSSSCTELMLITLPACLTSDRCLAKAWVAKKADFRFRRADMSSWKLNPRSTQRVGRKLPVRPRPDGLTRPGRRTSASPSLQSFNPGEYIPEPAKKNDKRARDSGAGHCVVQDQPRHYK